MTSVSRFDWGDLDAKILTCELCLQYYDCSISLDSRCPKRLICSHMFCETCVRNSTQVIEIKNPTIKCPLCNFTSRISGDVDDDLYISKLLEMSSDGGISPSTEKYCGNCDDGDMSFATFGCLDCNDESGNPGLFLCTGCADSHGLVKSLRRHSLLPIDSFVIQRRLNLRGNMTCTAHESKALNLCCESCQVAICETCAILKHENHRVVSIRDGAGSGRDRIAVSRASITEITERNRTYEFQLLGQQEALNKNESVLHEQIDGNADKLISILQRRRRAAHSVIDQRFNLLQKMIGRQLSEIQGAILREACCCDIVDRELSCGSFVDIYEADLWLTRCCSLLATHEQRTAKWMVSSLVGFDSVFAELAAQAAQLDARVEECTRILEGLFDGVVGPATLFDAVVDSGLDALSTAEQSQSRVFSEARRDAASSDRVTLGCTTPHQQGPLVKRPEGSNGPGGPVIQGDLSGGLAQPSSSSISSISSISPSAGSRTTAPFGWARDAPIRVNSSGSGSGSGSSDSLTEDMNSDGVGGAAAPSRDRLLGSRRGAGRSHDQYSCDPHSMMLPQRTRHAPDPATDNYLFAVGHRNMSHQTAGWSGSGGSPGGAERKSGSPAGTANSFSGASPVGLGAGRTLTAGGLQAASRKNGNGGYVTKSPGSPHTNGVEGARTGAGVGVGVGAVLTSSDLLQAMQQARAKTSAAGKPNRAIAAARSPGAKDISGKPSPLAPRTPTSADRARATAAAAVAAAGSHNGPNGSKGSKGASAISASKAASFPSPPSSGSAAGSPMSESDSAMAAAAAGTTTTMIGVNKKTGLGLLRCPTGLAVAAPNTWADPTDPHLFVVEYDAHRVHIFSSSSGARLGGGLGAGEGAALGQFKCPNGIVVRSVSGPYFWERAHGSPELPRGRGGHGGRGGHAEAPEERKDLGRTLIYIADSGNNRVQVFDAFSGEAMQVIGGGGGGGGHAVGPVAGPVDRSSHFQLRGPNGLCLLEASSRGRGHGHGHSHGQGSPGEAWATGAPSSRHTPALLFVAEYQNDRVQVFHADSGEHVRTIGSGRGAASGQMKSPYGVALLVCGHGHGYGGHGSTQGWDGTRGEEGANLSVEGMGGLSLSDSGDSDSYSGSGGHSGSLCADRVGTTASFGNGNDVLLFVSDSDNHRIQIFSGLTGGHLGCIGAGRGSGRGQLNGPAGLAVFVPSYAAGSPGGRNQTDVHAAEHAQAAHAGCAESSRSSLSASGDTAEDYLHYSSGAALPPLISPPRSSQASREGSAASISSGVANNQGGGDWRNALLFVADSDNHRVQVFHALSGSWVRCIGLGQGSAPGQLYVPIFLAVQPLSPYGGAQQQQQQPTHHQQAHQQGHHQAHRQAHSPAQALLYVSESGNNRVQVFCV